MTERLRWNVWTDEHGELRISRSTGIGMSFRTFVMPVSEHRAILDKIRTIAGAAWQEGGDERFGDIATICEAASSPGTGDA